MLAPIKRLVLRLAKVPAEPHAPAGSPGSIQVFRAAENYWKYLLVQWGAKQALGIMALVFFAGMSKVWTEAAIASPLVRHEALPSPVPGIEAPPEPPAKARRARRNRSPISETQARRVAGWIETIEALGIALFIVQAPFSLAKARLEYEMRWYIVTDRSLRIREGILSVREMTLTFANVQNISVHQGPLQRVLGIADVVVRTAGGGSSEASAHGKHPGPSMHEGRLRAVNNAETVRDLILERLRRFRDSGLGDPDDHRHHEPVAAPTDSSTLAAALALRDAARALTSALR